jgi:NADPH-dependent 2,4-dienoyl-CoA reductase/sulfur reductase-like enzyme
VEAELAEPVLEHFDCAVVGAGPAGLGAAIESAGAGLRTVLFDENDEPGGQLFKQIHKFFGSKHHKAGVRGFEIGRQLMSEAEAAGVEFRLGQPVWGAFTDQRLAVKGRSGSYQIHYDFLILATGATENPLSFPGWTLPGVMTAGAAQTMVNIRRVLPGKRVVMVGGGNVGLIVAYQIMQAGGTIVALVEASPRIGGYRVHLNKLLRAGVPVYTGHTILAAETQHDPEQSLPGSPPLEGSDRVASVLLGRLDGSDSFRIKADTVCVAVGLSPRFDLAALAGASLATLPTLGGWLPLHGREMEASDTVFVAGDLTGIEEAGTALDEGRIAGLAVAKRSGRLPVDQVEARIHQLRQSLAMLRNGKNGPARQAGMAEIEERYSRIKAGTP